MLVNLLFWCTIFYESKWLSVGESVVLIHYFMFEGDQKKSLCGPLKGGTFDGIWVQHQFDVHISSGVLTCCLVDVVGWPEQLQFFPFHIRDTCSYHWCNEVLCILLTTWWQNLLLQSFPDFSRNGQSCWGMYLCCYFHCWGQFCVPYSAPWRSFWSCQSSISNHYPLWQHTVLKWDGHLIGTPGL